MTRGRQLAIIGTVMIAAVPAWPLVEINRPALDDWTWPPLIVLPLLATAALYSFGVVKMLRTVRNPALHRRSIFYFAIGWISLLLVLDSPLHEIGEQLFWVHMTQHEILMLVSAPLIVLGRPLVPFLWSLTPSSRDRVTTMARSKVFTIAWLSISAPLSAWLLSALALWSWHAPWLFNQTLQKDWVHAAQHVTFLFTSLLFWWPLAMHRPAMGYGAALIYVFTTALHTSVLGALLTFSSRPWYSSYITTAPAWHLTALEDQQLGGLIMWIPGGTLLLMVTLMLLVRWMNDSKTRSQYTRMAELSRLSNGAHGAIR